MIEVVRATIARHDMLPAGMRVIAAVSGGPDSVCLVHLLRDLGANLVGVAHFNHRLRHTESDEDQHFVEQLAAKMGLAFYLESREVEAGNIEQNARRARREFFRRLIAEGKAERIALGHTRDDQAETVLFRIFRGSGPTGLAGVLPVTAEGLIRPLLDVRRSDVIGYLGEHKYGWREDSSNRSREFARNRIRHELLPHLAEAFNPHVVDVLAHLADVSLVEETWWAGEVARVAPSVFVETRDGLEIAAAALRALAPALQRRLIRYGIRRVKGDLRGVDYRHVEAIVRLVGSRTSSGRVTVPGLMGIRSFDRALLTTQAMEQPSPISPTNPGVYPWPARNPLIELELEAAASGSPPGDTLWMTLAELEVRGWRAGDRYQPEGLAKPVRVKELFQSSRVPSWQRTSWPILTRKGKIMWAKQFGPALGFSDAFGGIRIREIPSAKLLMDESFER